MNAPFRVLSLPGWQGSDAQHWQTRWEALQGHERVEQTDWQWPRRGDWMARLEETVVDSPKGVPIVLVAHSLGCQLVAAWAAHTRHSGRVQAALLVAPVDTERADAPPQIFNWRPLVRQRLPFDSLVVASRNDPYCDERRAVDMAADWGSQFVNIGDHGHINSDSALGDWPQGQGLLRGLLNPSSSS
ncbi:MAG: alpha/beta hydrolase [Pseudomonadota bacterium]